MKPTNHTNMRPQSAPMGRNLPTQRTVPVLNFQSSSDHAGHAVHQPISSHSTSLNTTLNNQHQQQNPMASRPLGRPSSAIAHLRLATALQNNGQGGVPQSAQLSSDGTRYEYTPTGASKLLRPQSASVASRYAFNVQPRRPNSATVSKGGAGLADGYDGLVMEADSSPTKHGDRDDDSHSISNEDSASIASLKGEVMLLQRVLESVEEFDMVFAYPSPHNTPRGHHQQQQRLQYQGTAQAAIINSDAPPAAYQIPTFRQPTAGSELEAIEQQLIAIQPALLTEKSAAEAKIALLELLVERVKAVSVAALRKCDFGAAELRVMPSRTSGFTTMVKYVMEIAERKRAWDHRLRIMNGTVGEDGTEFTTAADGNILLRGIIPSPPSQITSPKTAKTAAARAVAAANQASTAASPIAKLDPRFVNSISATHPITMMDLALNEPTVSEIQTLIAEQRQLQANLKKLLQQPNLNQSGSRAVSPATTSLDPSKQRFINMGGANPTTNQNTTSGTRSSLISNENVIVGSSPSNASLTGVAAEGTKGTASKRSSVVKANMSTSKESNRPQSAQSAAQFEIQLKLKTNELHSLSEKHDDVKKELAALRKAKEDADKELAVLRAKEVAQKLESASEWDIRNKVSGAAFGSDANRLQRYGVAPKLLELISMPEAESAVISNKMQQLFQEATAFVNENNATVKGRKVVKAVQDDVASQHQKQLQTVMASSAEKQQLISQLAMGSNGKGAKSSSQSPRALNGSLTNDWAAFGVTQASALAPLLPRSEALDGVAWATIHRQNTIITQMCDLLDDKARGHDAAGAESQSEIDRLNRIIKSLEERLDGLKVTNNRIQQSHDQLKYEFDERNRPDEEKFTTAADKVRIVQTKNQPLTAAERERELYRTIQAKDKKLENITDQLRSSKHELDDKAAEISSMSRERLSLLSKCAEESLKVQALQKQLEEAFTSKQTTQDTALAIKRELREKTVLEADNTQKLWKSQVELHIAHNVIAELRKREQQLLDDLDDAVEQRRILREQYETKAMDNRKMQATFELQLQEAKAAVDAAKFSLYQERQQMLANEKEMERLRVVDVQLETMEQNFNNYAVSMIVKREAGEEEERILGSCLVQIQEDVFALPDEAGMGEEQLTLMLAKLIHRKEVLENEARLNKQAELALLERKRHLLAQTTSSSNTPTTVNLREGPSANDKEKEAIVSAEEKLTNKKRLGLLLQRRYTDIQIFACERRLAEVRRGLELRETMAELKSVQQVHDTMLKELSQTRSQLDAMSQRSSELEVERKQLMKDRDREETSNKKLQAQVQRLNVTSEVQENMLVDLGTKLQNEKIAATSPQRGFTRALNTSAFAGGRQQSNLNGSNSQMTLTSHTPNGFGAVSNFGDNETDRGIVGNLGLTANSSVSQAAGTGHVVGKKQYNIAPLGPVL